MDEEERLLNATRWRRSWKTYRAASLGQVAQQLMDNRISPQQARFSEVFEVWMQFGASRRVAAAMSKSSADEDQIRCRLNGGS